MDIFVRVFSGVLICLICQTASAQVGSKNQSSQKSDLVAKTSRWVKMEVPLVVSHDESTGWASAEGFWQSTNPNKDQQLANPIAAKITCAHDEKICREVDATVMVFMLPWGSLNADSVEYSVFTWTRTGIVADTDANGCGKASRLTIDFKSNSVIVTDYPTKINVPKFCKAFQAADSYALHGGSWVLMPPPVWNPLEKNGQ